MEMVDWFWAGNGQWRGTQHQAVLGDFWLCENVVTLLLHSGLSQSSGFFL